MADFELLDIVDASGKPLRSQMIVDGHRINTFGKSPEETAKIIRNIVNLPVRDDDVFLVTPPKSGKPCGSYCISSRSLLIAPRLNAVLFVMTLGRWLRCSCVLIFIDVSKLSVTEIHN